MIFSTLFIIPIEPIFTPSIFIMSISLLFGRTEPHRVPKFEEEVKFLSDKIRRDAKSL